MYYYISGKLADKGEHHIVVDAGGVGYMINTSFTSISDAGSLGSTITMYTYLHVREDIMELYGFTSVEEKNMFINLLSVSGVGPKAALAVLSVVNPSKLALAVVTEDVKSITKAQGVGPKMAQRIILELKDKLKNEDIAAINEMTEEISDNRSEAVSALVSLGYSMQDARAAVQGIDGSLNSSEIIKKALASLF